LQNQPRPALDDLDEFSRGHEMHDAPVDGRALAFQIAGNCEQAQISRHAAGAGQFVGEAKLLQARQGQAAVGGLWIERIAQVQRKDEHLDAFDLDRHLIEDDVVGEHLGDVGVVVGDAIEKAWMVAQLKDVQPLLGRCAGREFGVKTAEIQDFIHRFICGLKSEPAS
jgi:hypothetical protein